MKRNEAKKKAANAVKAMLEAAKDFVEAEQAYCSSKPEPPQESPILSEEGKHAS